jgi:hypothetical protein
MNDTELQAIRDREQAATPGPWQQGATSMYSGRKTVHQDAAARKVNQLDWQRACICREARPDDGAFIAHARVDVPVLVEEIIVLRAAMRNGLRYLDYLKEQVNNAIEDLQNPNYQHGGYGMGIPDGVSLKWVEGVIERLQTAREADAVTEETVDV